MSALAEDTVRPTVRLLKPRDDRDHANGKITVHRHGGRIMLSRHGHNGKISAINLSPGAARALGMMLDDACNDV